jgi:Concanavalin A-like lectin/glucanases superfamily
MSISLQQPYRPAGLSFWYDSTNVSSNYIQPANLASVPTWTNLFNNNFLNATNGTGANQPTFNSNASNGIPSLVFNGTTQTLAVPATNAIQIAGQFTFIATIQIASLLSAQQTLFSKGLLSGTLNYAIQLNRTAPGQVSFNNGTAWVDSPTNFSKTGVECVIVAVVWTGSVYAFYGNGVNLGTVSNSTAVTANTEAAVIAAQGATSLANKFGGEILNMALWRRFMSAQDFTDTYRYFANRAGLKSL